MIYDCFTFFNELDILEIRLSILYKYVDYFVIVEADKSWRLNPKKFILDKERERFKKYFDKIKYIQVTDLPDDNDPWKIEEFQRNAITRGLQDCKDVDIIIISDVDEIWDPRILEECNLYPSRIEMPFYYYCLNYKINQMWILPVICNYSVIQKTTPNNLRQKTKNVPVFGYKPGDLAFHLSFFYGKNYTMYVNKIENFNHSEYDRSVYKNKDHIKYCIKYGKDIFIRKEIKIIYIKNKKLLANQAFLNFRQYYFNRNLISLIPSFSDLKSMLRIHIFKHYPEIKYENKLVNSIKYILKKKIRLFKVLQ